MEEENEYFPDENIFGSISNELIEGLISNNVQDLDKSIEFLSEYPERCRYFFYFNEKESKFSFVLMGCESCKKLFSFPYRIMYFCEDNSAGFSYCEDCYLNSGYHSFYIDILFNVFHKFSDDLIKMEETKIDDDFKDIFYWETFRDEKKKKSILSSLLEKRTFRRYSPGILYPITVADNVLSKIIVVDDYEECFEYLIEYPQRSQYFLREDIDGKYKIICIECNKCSKKFCFPEKIMYHPKPDTNYCEDCFDKEGNIDSVPESLHNIYFSHYHKNRESGEFSFSEAVEKISI